jgi:predicted DNA-binding protein (MmcQ/YjbR family)
MISAASFRKSALAFDQAIEQPHFYKASFRVKGKIFATLDSVKKQASLKLTETDQSIYCLVRPSIAVPANGAWGKQGWTIFNLDKAVKSILEEALKKSYTNVSPKEISKTKSSKKTANFIQTLHPDKSKTNKKILLEKYQFIKDELIKILQSAELSHSQLMERLHQNVKDIFEGGVQWYGETVKLDLEARKIIERTGSKPEIYRLRKQSRAGFLNLNKQQCLY